MKKREKRIKTEVGRLGTERAGSGWASKQAAKRANRGKKLTTRAIRRRMSRGLGRS
jgi:hypothetical protein